MDHSHNSGISCVTCVCDVCGRVFRRRTNNMNASLSFSTPGGMERQDPKKCRTVRDWIIAMGNHCDEHLPPVPKAVLADEAKERERRGRDSLDFSEFNSGYSKTVEEWKKLARTKGYTV